MVATEYLLTPLEWVTVTLVAVRMCCVHFKFSEALLWFPFACFVFGWRVAYQRPAAGRHTEEGPTKHSHDCFLVVTSGVCPG